MRCAIKILVLAAACAWASVGISQSQATQGQDAEPLFVEVQADGQHCKVRSARVLCTDVLPHLRNVLKLPPGSIIRFRAGRSAPYAAVKSVMDELTKSEFRTPVALR
jgi:biopolymer transport protein ExbD